ncbi:MAG: Ppx/GppA family phosphatase [Deltaproteobacteria bacterium]|nr:Ppx/GppA family phosphatase [Deltaproteobacteria bacterium]
MRIAIIDLGTNSVRFDVQQVSHDGRIRQLHREKLMVRLGQGVFLGGKLDPTASRRAIEALASFRKVAHELRANKIVAFATSALREAADRERFLALARKKLGIEVRIISGLEEAKLIALGILSNERNVKGRVALVDIGGGSSEISLCKGGDVVRSESFSLGTARLQQVFLKSNPPRPEAIEQLRRHIRGVLLSRLIADGWPKVGLIIGSSGTTRTLAKMAKKDDDAKSISRAELKKLVRQLAKLDTTELLDLPGMEARRVDMILAGAILLDEFMSALRSKKVRTTAYSLRDGILREEIQYQKHHSKSRVPFRVPDLIEKAARFGEETRHAERNVRLAEKLFRRTRSLHKLKPEWEIFLKAAMILRCTGKAISAAKHEQHSAYIARNMDLHTIEPWELELVAQLCLHHDGIKPEIENMPFKGNKRLRQVFLKLLALLRIAGALDAGSALGPSIRKVARHKRKIEISLEGKGAVSLEALRVEQRQPLFLKIFRKQPVVLER